MLHKIPYLALSVFLCSLLLLSGCAGNVSFDPDRSSYSDGIKRETSGKTKEEKQKETSTEKQEPESNEAELPTVYYSDITSGRYDEKNVKLTIMVENPEDKNYSDFGFFHFDAWVLDADGSFVPCLNQSIHYEIEEGDTFLIEANADDFYIAEAHVHAGSSFGIKKLLEKIDAVRPVEEVYQSFMATCATVPLEDFLRNPDEHFYDRVKYSGIVYQVVKEEYKLTEMLLDIGDPDHMIYLLVDDELRPNGRFLEGDSISFYGYYYTLQKYTTLTGAKEAPKMEAIILSE